MKRALRFKCGLADTTAIAAALESDHADTIARARAAFARCAEVVSSDPKAMWWLADAFARDDDGDLFAALTTLATVFESAAAYVERGVAAHTAQCRADQCAIEHHLSYAVERMRTLERMRNTALQRKRGDAATLAKRAKLGEAGLDPAEIDRLAPLFDSAAIERDLAAIDAEYLELSAFIRSADVSAAPDGFDAAVAEYREIVENTRRMRGIEADKLAVC